VASVNALRKGILYHDELSTLSLQQAQIGNEGLDKLVTSLDKLSNLQVLRLSGNRLTSDSVSNALKAISAQNQNIRELDLSNNLLDGSIVESLAILLKQNPKLHYLNLSGNIFGDEGAEFLAQALTDTTAVIPTLELMNNKIGDRGVEAIGRLVNANTNIGILLLSGNQIRNDGALALSKALVNNFNVTKVDLAGNNIGAPGALALREYLENNIDIMNLNLSGNPLMTGSKPIADLLHVDGFNLESLAFVRNKLNVMASRMSMALVVGDVEDDEGEE